MAWAITVKYVVPVLVVALCGVQLVYLILGYVTDTTDLLLPKLPILYVAPALQSCECKVSSRTQ